MKKLLCLFLLLEACSTTQRKEPESLELGSRPVVIANAVPFAAQTEQLCGPTALYMAIKSYKPTVTLEEITKMTLSPGANGTFKQDLLAGARRYGMAPYPVSSLGQMVDRLAAGTPIVLFHRTSFLWKDFWHFSVITGYDSLKDKFFMHIGTFPYREEPIAKILDSWKTGGRWSYILVPPKELPPFASIDQVIDNGLAFLRLGLLAEAEELGAAAVLRWPRDYEAEVVLADALMRQNKKREALQHLRQATRKNPANLLLRQKLRQLSKR